jgi:hypothetical protein
VRRRSQKVCFIRSTDLPQRAKIDQAPPVRAGPTNDLMTGQTGAEGSVVTDDHRSGRTSTVKRPRPMQPVPITVEILRVASFCFPHLPVGSIVALDPPHHLASALTDLAKCGFV